MSLGLEINHQPTPACHATLRIAGLFAWLIGLQADSLSAGDLYLEKVKPLLQQRCGACHGALKQAAGLRLDTAAAIRHGGDSGPAVVLVDSERSELLQRVRSPQSDVRMPPEGQPLTVEEISALERWIAAGAQGPESEQPQADPMAHWAFQPPVARSSPYSSSGHPIDSWLDAAAQSRDCHPYPPAAKRVWLRRVTIDLLGLPPTPEEMQAFLQDNTNDAVERVVDRLLNRPEYGQRWARHWMDVWRYSDWYGRRAVPDVMNSYPQIWRWRDWIVNSLNQDKGYDRMLMEMLAADELAPDDDENIVATGFIVRNWFKWNYETWMKDNVEHTARAFLGLTMQCAMCHDHKYDPITHEDYFRFRAFFEPLELRHDRVAGEVDPGPFQKYEYTKSYGPIKSGAIRIFDEKLNAETFMFRGGDARNRIEGKAAIPPGPPRVFTTAEFSVSSIDLPATAAYPGLKEFIRAEESAKCQAAVTTAQEALTKAQQSYQLSQQQWQDLAEKIDHFEESSEVPSSDALISVQQQRLAANSALEQAELSVRVAQNRASALQARIVADDAEYHRSASQEIKAQNAFRAEQLVAFEEAQLQRLRQESSVLTAEHALSAAAADKQEAAKKTLADAKQKLMANREAEDQARSRLNTLETNYTRLSPKYPERSTGRRLALARWIASKQNPLTARVAINHMWLRHFGQPLVESVDNFGHQGKNPSHPELLDWLATELMNHDWSMKHIHRLIVTSAAYRRSSSLAPGQYLESERFDYRANLLETNVAKDRENICLWRFPTRRMEAEVVRDSVLVVAGELDRKPGGHEIELSEWITSRRRSMYFSQHGEQQMQFLQTFDGVNVCECYRRSTTVLPVQALALTNSELLVHFSRLAASHLLSQYPGPSADLLDDTRFTQYSFEVLLGRPPSSSEHSDSLQFLADQRQALAQALSESGSAVPASELKQGIQPAAQDVGQRARENLVMALFNHSDFLTIR